MSDILLGSRWHHMDPQTVEAMGPWMRWADHETLLAAAIAAAREAGYAQAVTDEYARLEGYIAAAVAAEREACAKEAEGRIGSTRMHRATHDAFFLEEERRRECKVIAAAIRARGDGDVSIEGEASHDR